MVDLHRVNLALVEISFLSLNITPTFWLAFLHILHFFTLHILHFKSLNFLAPTYLYSLISLRLPSKYNLRNSSDNLLLSYPRFKSIATLGDRSFTSATLKLWNALPFDIRSASTVSIFKAELKTHLIRHALLAYIVVFIIVSLLLIVILAF